MAKTINGDEKWDEFMREFLYWHKLQCRYAFVYHTVAETLGWEDKENG